MSQVSYGTITIVDTTDIARIYMVYAKSVSNTTPPSDELTWSESIASAPGEGDFIWQKTVVEKAITEEKTYSDPVCVTGSSGQGVEKIINYYCNYGQGQPEEDYSGWQLEIPEYDGNKPNYWTKVVVIYSDDTREDFQASGTIATFENEKVGVFDSLEVALSPIQDLHGYDKPWVGGAGKNKLDQSAYTWLDATSYSNGVFTAETRTPFNSAMVRLYKNGKAVSTINKAPTEGSRVSMNVTVDDTWDFCFIGYRMGGASNVGGSFNKPIVPDGTYTVSFMADKLPSTSVYGKFSNIQFESGSTATSYEPYTNICPISGWDEVETVVSGVNVWDEEWEVGGYAGANGNPWNTTDRIRSKTTNYISVVPNTSYRIYSDTWGSSGGGKFFTVFFYDADKNYISYSDPNNGTTFTTPNNAHFVRFAAQPSYGTTYNNDISINYPSTDTDYHPYDGHTYTTDLPQTVYGGTLDVVSGVLTVDRAMITIDGTNYNMAMSGGSKRCYISDLSVPKAKPSPNTHTPAPNLIANYLTAVGDAEAYSGAVGVCIYATASANIGFTLTGKVMTFAEVKSYLASNPLQVCYELATPTTIQCDPQTVQTLIGDNNVWGGGTVEVRGHTISKRDVMIYKDNGLTDVVDKSAEANTNAAEALEKANDGIVSTTQLWYQTNSTSAPSVPTNHSQIDQGTITYNNWRSIRPNNSVDSYKYYYYCYEYLHGDGTYTYSAEAVLDTSNLSQYQIDQLQVRIKKMWSNSTGSYMASGIGSDEVDIDNLSTYGFNSKTTTTGISFNYNNYKTIELDGSIPALKIYEPSKTSQGTQTVQIDSNGMKLLKGGIEAGQAGQDGFIYLSTIDYSNSITINSYTPGSNNPKWRQIIGTNFGVDSEGNLYANNANISGTIDATSFTAKSYTGTTLNRQMLLGADGLKLMDGSGTILSQIDGSASTIGKTSGNSYNINITGSAIDLRYNTNVLNRINSSGMILYDGDGVLDNNIIAKFVGDSAQIGKLDENMITINSNGMEIWQKPTGASTSVKVAEFGADGAQIGQTGESHLEMDYHSMQLKDKEGTTYFYASDLRDKDDNYQATITETFLGDGSTRQFTVSFAVSAEVSAVDGSDASNTATRSGRYYTFASAPAKGATVTITYKTLSADAKAYTLGIRGSGATGALSVAEGYHAIASGYCSHAEGYYTTASGRRSHAEGDTAKANGDYSHAEGVLAKAIGRTSHAEGGNTTASGDYSHAEGGSTTTSGDYSHAEGSGATANGDYSHAEGSVTKAMGTSSHAEGGNTTASGYFSHAEGGSTTASGDYSHAQNLWTTAQRRSQTAIGEYNSADTGGTDETTRGDYVFMIGNGTYSTPSNALTVDWDGNVTAAQNITVNNHSSHIGTFKSYISDNISCATEKYYQLAYLTLEAGVWMVDYVGYFPNTNTTGIRDTFVTTATSEYNNVTTAPDSYGNITRDRRTGAAHIIYCKSHFPVSIASTTTFRLIGYQNSGQTNSLTGRMYAVRIN